jgi:HEAT repeat protein
MKMKSFIDFNTQRVCPSCGKIIKVNHNFCKYCGVDLSEIKAMGKSDDPISINLANTAVTDPAPEVRKEAVDTLGAFKETKVLGVLTLVLLNDPDENVRKEAADELGDLHHPYSMNALSLALKDESSIVRKEAIEGLKKIKEKDKKKKVEEREIQ